MPQTNELILEKTQAALEVTRGTDLPATRKVYVAAVGSYEKELVVGEDRTGTFLRRRRATYKRPAISFTFDADATFEDLPWWFQLGIKGGVTGVTDAGSPPAFTYTFNPTITSDDLKSMTMEFNESGNPYQSTQVMVDEWSLKIDPDNEGAWKFSAKALGRDWTTTTYTGALTDRVTEAIPAPGTLLYIDAAGGTIGTTPVTGKFIGGTVTYKNNVHFKGFAEDKAAWAANKVGRGELEIDTELMFEWDADGEFANLRATDPVERLVRVESSGTQIHGGTPANKRARLDFYGFWSTWASGDRDGNKIMTMNLAAFYDVTAAKAFQAEVVNALTTLP